MKEILENKIVDKKFNPYLNQIQTIKKYHIYYNEHLKIVKVDAPLKVKHLIKLRKLLVYDNIDYKNIIIGKPDI